MTQNALEYTVESKQRNARTLEHKLDPLELPNMDITDCQERTMAWVYSSTPKADDMLPSRVPHTPIVGTPTRVHTPLKMDTPTRVHTPLKIDTPPKMSTPLETDTPSRVHTSLERDVPLLKDTPLVPYPVIVH